MSHTELVSNNCGYCVDQWWDNSFNGVQLFVNETSSEIQVDNGQSCFTFSDHDQLFEYFSPKPEEVDLTQILDNKDNKFNFYSLTTSALEVLTIASAWKIVGPNMVYAFMAASALQLFSAGIEYLTKNVWDSKDEFRFLSDFIHGSLKHIAFYEIASNKVLKEYYIDFVQQFVLGNEYGNGVKYLVDIFYYMMGNIASSGITYSFLDVINNHVMKHDTALEVEMDPFLNQTAPKVAVKRFIKEAVKDSVISSYIGFNNYGDYSLENYIDSRVTPDLRVQEYHDIDDTTIPSLLGHFSANAFIAGYYNGLSFEVIYKTFFHSFCKYLPEVVLSRYVFAGSLGMKEKYLSILATSLGYLIAKRLVPVSKMEMSSKSPNSSGEDD